MDGVTVTYATKTHHIYMPAFFFFITLEIEHVKMFWNVNRCNLYNVGLVIPEKPENRDVDCGQMTPKNVT